MLSKYNSRIEIHIKSFITGKTAEVLLDELEAGIVVDWMRIYLLSIKSSSSMNSCSGYAEKAQASAWVLKACIISIIIAKSIKYIYKPDIFLQKSDFQ